MDDASSTGGAGKPPVIELKQVTVICSQPPKKPILENVDWSAARGEFWVVAGMPGTGKSELLAAMAGLVKPAKGSALVLGKEPHSIPERELVELRLRVGVVFQYGGRLFRNLTVAENVALPICYHGNATPEEAGDEVFAVLRLLGLEALARTMPDEAQRSLLPRIALARALAMRPEVLLLDNPLLGVDVRQAMWWLKFLGELARGHDFFGKRPMTIVVMSDQLRPWKDYAGRFAIVHHGMLEEVGGREDLIAGTDPLVRELMSIAE